MKRCLITGASGLIGQAVIPLLIENGWEVYYIGRKPIDQHVNCCFIQHDLEEKLPDINIDAPIDAIIHLAQSEHFREFPKNAGRVFGVNVLSTAHLLDFAYRYNVKKFVLASSGGIYGHSNAEFSEEDPVYTRQDLGYYLGTKLCSEILAESYTTLMNIAFLRFFFVYGPRQKRDMLIPRLIQLVREGNPIYLQGEQGIKINPVYVDDAAMAIYKSLHLDASQKINVGGPDILSMKDVGDIISQALGKTACYQYQKDQTPQHLIGDVTKMTRFLQAPKVSFREGVLHCL